MAVINESMLPKIQDIAVANLWLQYDRTICHMANDTIALLETLNENIMSNRGRVNWQSKLHH